MIPATADPVLAEESALKKPLQHFEQAHAPYQYSILLYKQFVNLT